MFHIRNFLLFLYRTSLIALLSLCIIMLLHILIITLGTSFMLWHTDSTPFDMALLTFLYYVIPFIALFCFHFFISQLVKLEEYAYAANRSKQIAKNRSLRTEKATSKASSKTSSQTKNHPHNTTSNIVKNHSQSATTPNSSKKRTSQSASTAVSTSSSTRKNRPCASSYVSRKKVPQMPESKIRQTKKRSTYTAYASSERPQN